MCVDVEGEEGALRRAGGRKGGGREGESRREEGECERERGGEKNRQ